MEDIDKPKTPSNSQIGEKADSSLPEKIIVEPKVSPRRFNFTYDIIIKYNDGTEDIVRDYSSLRD